jgi:16S rRNA (cytosine1402-N4)-methyltransferase
MSDFYHISVLLQECIDGLAIKSDGIYVDGTLGGAGHSGQIVRCLEKGLLVGIDRDPVALKAAGERLAPFGERVKLVHSNFCEMADVLQQLNISGVDGILLDLGVSSPQLDDGSRGFSYMADAPLDMRMNGEDSLSAYEVVNTWSQEELKRILYDYGEERYAPQIAAAICRRRENKPIETTLELVDVIRSAMPPAALREKQHPAKRSFQAIRIAVNDELGSVEKAMAAAIPLLNPGGRLAVITFHSLEDRIVKNAMVEASKGCTCPPNFPVCVCGKKPKVKLISRKPIVSSAQELEANPRARSAKLRVCEKL